MVTPCDDHAVATLRELTRLDLSEALAWRREVLNCVFADDGPWDHESIAHKNEAFLEHHLGKDLVFCIASLDGEDVGCGALCLQPELPSPDNPSGLDAYLMNVYARDGFRGRGVGHSIVTRLVEKARALGAGKVYLEATEDGRPVYESLGFCPMEGVMKMRNAAE